MKIALRWVIAALSFALLILSSSARTALGQCDLENEVATLISSQQGNGNFYGTDVAVDIDASGNIRAAIGSIETLNGRKGAVHFYRRANGVWTLEARQVPAEVQDLDELGTSVDIAGTFAIAGAPLTDVSGFQDAGAAWVFTRMGGAWPPDGPKLIAGDAGANDQFGAAVAMTSDGTLLQVIIGAPGDDDEGTNAGAAYVFHRTGNGIWIEDDKLVATELHAGDRFGVAVDIEGDVAIVGAPSEGGDDVGLFFVFKREAPAFTWQKVAGPIVVEGFFGGESFGAAVSLSGSVAVVGAPRQLICDIGGGTFPEPAGAAYVFNTPDLSNPVTWTPEENPLVASDCTDGDRFGAAVEVIGDQIIVGTSFADAAYFFRFVDGQWLERAKLVPSSATGGAEFGSVVGLATGIPVVADQGFNPGAVLNDGKAYFFSFEEPDSPDCNESGLLDACDIAIGTSLDCNSNETPDECDLAEGKSPDCNQNAVPDECDLTADTSRDCNANATPDECDIALGTSADAEGDGIPDECSCVDVVFIIDTSQSMVFELNSICQNVVAPLIDDGHHVDVPWSQMTSSPARPGTSSKTSGRASRAILETATSS